MAERPARWPPRLGIAGLVGLALALLGWRAGVSLLERASPPALDEPVPRCPGTLNPAYRAAADDARRHLQAMLREREIPGLTVGVAIAGRLVWSEGMGYADRDAGRPACPTMQFRLQSVSKLITAAAMARLVERGVLDLDTPVWTYVPDLSPALGAVTARQLASHRAGVRHYRDDNESLNTTRYETATASLEKFRDDPLLFPPDGGSAYSSYGFVLLSAALEGATGLDFPTIIRREIAAPLRLERTEAERHDSTRLDRVTFYDNVTPYSFDGRVVESPDLDFSSKWAGGGILSTAEDIARFGNAHVEPFNAGFLADSTLQVLLTPRTRQFLVFGQGLGWAVARDHRLRRVALHFGAGSGGTSFVAVYPRRAASIVVLANLGHARFPMARLLGVVNPFVGDPVGPVAWLGGVAALGLALLLWRQLRAGPRQGASRPAS